MTVEYEIAESRYFSALYLWLFLNSNFSSLVKVKIILLVIFIYYKCSSRILLQRAVSTDETRI